IVVLGDDEAGLRATVTGLARDHVAIVITGGLGPTLDDVTREACAAAAGVDLVRDEGVVASLRALFAGGGRGRGLSIERRGWCRSGAAGLETPLGTATGFALPIDHALVLALPGPPREMQPMLEQQGIPRLRQHAPASEAIETRRFYLF